MGGNNPECGNIIKERKCATIRMDFCKIQIVMPFHKEF